MGYRKMYYDMVSMACIIVQGFSKTLSSSERSSFFLGRKVVKFEKTNI